MYVTKYLNQELRFSNLLIKALTKKLLNKFWLRHYSKNYIDTSNYFEEMWKKWWGWEILTLSLLPRPTQWCRSKVQFKGINTLYSHKNGWDAKRKGIEFIKNILDFTFPWEANGFVMVPSRLQGQHSFKKREINSTLWFFW